MSASGMQRIAVIGSGLMGHGIALELAAHGYDIRLHDRDQAQLARARDSIAEGLARLVAIERLSAEDAAAAPAHITMGTDLRETVAAVDLVIEAVTEDLELKRATFRDLDSWAPPHAILASNSSSFMPSLLAAVTNRPDKVLVAHYFNPPHLLPLVELVRGEQTSDATIETMRALYAGIGKSPAVVQREAPGFVGNRLQMALLREALAIVDAGIATPADVDTIIKTSFGRRLAVAGVFEVFEAAGWDLTLAVAEQLFPAIDRSTAPPASLREKVACGELGLKAGKGFYEWTPEEAAALRGRIGNGLAAIARLSDG
ncbi:MAG: 3-hydroxyacyl-CoA dehydrogenase family protein [Thermomicrobiales bacterium]